MNIFRNVHIHLFYYVVALICVVTGYFKDFVIVTILILIHELGHIIPALLFRWKIEKIVILPFGGITIFQEKMNRPMKEELWIVIGGPMLQCFFYLGCCLLFGESSALQGYHYAILLFNLLPIYPLDGSKLLNLLLNYIFPFKISHKIMVLLSILTILVLTIISFVKQFPFLFFMMLFFLAIKVIGEFLKHDLIFGKFLLERYLYSFSFSKKRTIVGEKYHLMKRDHKHLFLLPTGYQTEKKILQKMFDKK